MTDIPSEPHPSERPGSRLAPRASVVVAATVVGLALVLWGGYSHKWSWTGINGSTATLWDWLHLLLLPIAFGLLPVLLSRDTRLRSHHKVLVAAALAAFGIFVIAGYTIPWAWTGFQGNKLWDWLELLALPLAVALAPVVRDVHDSWGTRHSLSAAAGLAIFLAVVIGGYVGGWAWTGFQGNTLWDWLHLLLLPLLLPTIIVPALVPVAKTRMAIERAEEPASGDDSAAVE